jgi:hypothetical protein
MASPYLQLRTERENVDKHYRLRKEKEMRVSGDEMREFPRFLREQTPGAGASPAVDSELNNIVLGQLREIPDVRVELVDSLRRAIREKRYNVPEERVAESMIFCCPTAP